MRTRAVAATAMIATLTASAAACATGRRSGHPDFAGVRSLSETSSSAPSQSEGLAGRPPRAVVTAIADYVRAHPAVHVSVRDRSGVFTQVDTSPSTVKGFTTVDGLVWQVRMHNRKTYVHAGDATGGKWDLLAADTPGGRTIAGHTGFGPMTSFFHVRIQDVDGVDPARKDGQAAVSVHIGGSPPIVIYAVDDAAEPRPLSVESGTGKDAVVLTYSKWGELISAKVPDHQ